MEVKLMNSRMMPADGIYFIKQISADQFADEVVLACKNGVLESYIGYQQTAEMITRMTGLPIPVSRAATTVSDGDVMLIASPNYRPDAPTKGAAVDEKDFQFYVARYWSHFVS